MNAITLEAIISRPFGSLLFSRRGLRALRMKAAGNVIKLLRAFCTTNGFSFRDNCELQNSNRNYIKTQTEKQHRKADINARETVLRFSIFTSLCNIIVGLSVVQWLSNCTLWHESKLSHNCCCLRQPAVGHWDKSFSSNGVIKCCLETNSSLSSPHRRPRDSKTFSNLWLHATAWDLNGPLAWNFNYACRSGWVYPKNPNKRGV